ncbi:M15 family metallopeptidase, partial [Candidatus Saccharibacteria bacterium]|nr:M15 family metallopeptidase [Candidatus Saccharibacteria bacterium]
LGLGGSGAGSSGHNKSMDGMKAGGADKTPSMLRGMDGDSSPHATNSHTPDKAGGVNPSAADSAKKMAMKKVGEHSQAAADAIDIADKGQKIGRTLSGDGTAAASLAKDVVSDPKGTAELAGRTGKYFALFFGFQILLVVAIVGVLFFGVYKVYLTAKEAASSPTAAASLAFSLNGDMASYLAEAVTQLTYERDIATAKAEGRVFAQEGPNKNFDLSAHEVNPETKKMYDAWDNAGIAEKFLDEYNAKIVPNGTKDRQVESFDASAWDLYIGSKNIGSLDSDRAQAAIGTFTEDATHWKDIYMRASFKGASKKSFAVKSHKLELPNSEKNLDKSRENVTKKLVDDTLTPITTKSRTYYECLIKGEDACLKLGLGSKEAANNSSGSPARNTKEEKLLYKNFSEGKLATFAKTKSDEIAGESSTYKGKSNLAANIITDTSDTVLSSVLPEENSGSKEPNPETLLQMYDRFQTALDNENYSRVVYDRTSNQSVAGSMNYFVAGGQLLNNEMGLLDSWAFTENLSVLEESPIFRASVLGNSGVFAQSTSSANNQSCQKVYDDEAPVKKAGEEDPERPIKSSSCFKQALVPNIAEFKQEKDLNVIYKQLEERRDQLDNPESSGGGWWGDIGERIKGLTEGTTRTSPVATVSVNIDPSLSPDLDAYNNQVYGVARTGAEINGEAYDTMKMAADSIWSSAGVDETYSTGGKYLNKEEVAQNFRYAQKMEKLQFANKSLSTRLFAITDSKSLTGKLALLTPTNRDDGAKKTLALFSPTNLTSAVASRMMPATFAQTAEDPNPTNAAVIGIGVGDPVNSQSSKERWDSNNCAAGGPTQESTKPDGVPFTLPSKTNVCKRDTMVARYATCYLTDEECDPGAGATQTSDSTTPGAISADSSGTPCYAGTEDLGIRDDAYTKGNRIKIRLCAVNSIAGTSEESTGKVPGANGRALVSSIASEAWQKLGELAKAQGVPLTAGSSWRTMAHQQQLCDDDDKCPGGDYNDVAKPGTSNHQAGTAIDISQIYQATSGPASGRTCSNPQTASNATYVFVAANARTFGLKNYANEAWHWGTSESC